MISSTQLSQAIHKAGFTVSKRKQVNSIVSTGFKQFREYEKNWYYSHTGKKIKKPSLTHKTKIGRYDQKEARTILISALCRAWMEGTGEAPTLNNKKDYDSDFFQFARNIMALEGIGNIHAHPEEYWSTRKKTAEKCLNIKKGRLS